MQSKPNLVFVATRVPYPPVTGHYLRTLNILRGLAEHFSVHFFGFRDKSGTPGDHALARAALESICSTVHIETVGAERSKARLLVDLVISLLAFQPYTAAKYHSRRMHRAIREMLSTHDVAVAHADSLQSGQYLTDVSRPKILTNHNVEHLRLSSHAAQRGMAAYRLGLQIQAALTKRYERRILEAIGNCIAVSESDRNELSRLAPGVRYFVVRNGTDTSLPPLPPADASAASALWVGGMNDPFNREGVLHFAAHVLPRIRELVPGFLWHVVGRDPPKALLELAGSPVSGVELAGFVPTVREAYERSAIVVVPLLSGGGTKLKVLEAMAMGRAVVTTPVGAEGINARDGVEMEIAPSDEEFAHRVAALLHDPGRRDRMAAAARKLVEREYAWEMVNRDMHSAVQSIIEAHPRPTRAIPCAE